MSGNEPGTPASHAEDRKWRVVAFAALGVILAVGALLAFLVLPAGQRENAELDLWSAICRAAGITPGSPAYRQPLSTAAALPVSQVSWTPQVLSILRQGKTQRGAMLAGQVCASCHGETGITATAGIPSLAGQTSAAIYKQLSDYRSGARVHPSMSGIAQQLAPADLAAVAAYYGGVVNVNGLGEREAAADARIVKLAREGDPARRIPACASCHVNGAGGPTETPILTGQDHSYLEAQMLAFKHGQRRNDVYRRMRSIAEALNDEEIAALARYYQGVV